MLELNKIYNMDCLEGMRQMEDNSVDLVVTDPPYGIGAANGIGRINKVFNGNWDNDIPQKDVFDNILRIGKVVMVFGGNYFTHLLPQSNSWVVWDKIGLMKNDGTNFSDVELIWTNLKRNTSKKYVYIHRGGMVDGEFKYHPTQKPLRLIIKMMKDYSKEGDTILDPFMGSGTTAVACKQLGRNFIGFEISKEYCDIANKRLQQENLLEVFKNV